MTAASRSLLGPSFTVLLGLAGLLGGRTDRVAVVLLTGLVAVAVAWSVGGPRRAGQVGLAAGLVIAASLPPWRSAGLPFERLGIVLGAGLGVVALVAAVAAVRHQGWARATMVALALGAAGLSVTGLRTGVQLAFLVLTGLSVAAVVRGGLDLAGALGVHPPPVAEQPVEHRDRLLAQLSYDDGDRVGRFLVLMVLSTTIAALGVMTDSTAVVIGAMLVAPLMTPLMGVALSLGMGWLGRAQRTAGVAVLGIVLAVGLSALLAAVLPLAVAVDANPQVTSRAAPTLLDLLIAMAAGTAGAYAMSRPDVSDALPGVAIAISLVPPLAVVGIALEQGARGAAAGALLLFTTNLVAILVAGITVFAATGVLPRSRRVDPDATRATASALAAAMCLVIGGLSLSGERLLEATSAVTQAEAVVQDWLADTLPGAGLQQVTVDGDTVLVELSGPDPDLVDASDLAERFAEARGRQVEVRVGVVPREEVTAVAAPD